MQPTFSSNPHTHFSGSQHTMFGNGEAANPQSAPAHVTPFPGEVAFGKKHSLTGPQNGDVVSFSGCCH